MAQVGFLTHQVAFLKPALGVVGAGWAVSLTTAAAVAGRLVVSTFVDRVNRRLIAAGNFVLQILALALLLSAQSPVALYVGCALFGLGVGNMTSLPSLIVQVEFPKAAFGRVVSAAVAVNQFTYSFGPSLLGGLHDWTGDYRLALLACIALLLAATAIVLSRRSAPRLAPQPQ